MLDLLSRVQALGAGTSTIQYGMAAVELKLIIYCLQSLLGIFITAITDPPAYISRITRELSFPHCLGQSNSISSKLEA